MFQASTSGFLSFTGRQLYSIHPPQTPQAWKDYCKDTSVVAPFWASLNTDNLNKSSIVFGVLQRDFYNSNGYNSIAQRELDKAAKVFKDADFIDDNFKPRIAIVSTWNNATFGLDYSSSRKEVGQYIHYLHHLCNTPVIRNQAPAMGNSGSLTFVKLFPAINPHNA